MSMLAISKNLSCRFYGYAYRQVTSVNPAKNSYLWTQFNSRFNYNHLRNYCAEKKWITIIFVKANGTRVERKGEVGKTLLDVVFQDPDFPGFGECRGTKACATCHVIFSQEDFDTIGKHSFEDIDESDVLDGIEQHFPRGGAAFRTDTSRLGCCINLIPEMDGMVIKLPNTRNLMGY